MSLQVACKASAVASGAVRRAVVDNVMLAIVHAPDGQWYALAGQCSHMGSSLAGGEVIVDGDTCLLRCPGHGALFDVATGRPTTGPAFAPIATYPVVLDGDAVLVDVEGVK
ncbi:MAG: Rieske 2Fe-2S domain-containing protein [Promicromonosporaceae bacterium]|nr:Rieske 2Fe-2S domain-containing protein [Promicromonosporaceae bacterium]